MTMQCKQVDIGDKCVECLRSTSFGSGLFVNRIPADNDNYIGWLCPECNFHECDRSVEVGKFSDGAYRVHYDCLTEKEKQLMEENNA